jgi:hypothetical protein
MRAFPAVRPNQERVNHQAQVIRATLLQAGCELQREGAACSVLVRWVKVLR